MWTATEMASTTYWPVALAGGGGGPLGLAFFARTGAEDLVAEGSGVAGSLGADFAAGSVEAVAGVVVLGPSALALLSIFSSFFEGFSDFRLFLSPSSCSSPLSSAAFVSILSPAIKETS